MMVPNKKSGNHHCYYNCEDHECVSKILYFLRYFWTKLLDWPISQPLLPSSHAASNNANGHVRCWKNLWQFFVSMSSGSSIWHPPCRQAAKQEEKSKVGGKDSRATTVYLKEMRYLCHKCPHRTKLENFPPGFPGSGRSGSRLSRVFHLSLSPRQCFPAPPGGSRGVPRPDEIYNPSSELWVYPRSIPVRHVRKTSKGRLSGGMLIRCPNNLGWAQPTYGGYSFRTLIFAPCFYQHLQV